MEAINQVQEEWVSYGYLVGSRGGGGDDDDCCTLVVKSFTEGCGR